MGDGKIKDTNLSKIIGRIGPTGKELLTEFDRKGLHGPVRVSDSQFNKIGTPTQSPDTPPMYFLHDVQSNSLYMEIADLHRFINSIFFNSKHIMEAYQHISEFLKHLFKLKETLGSPDAR